jgi:hypothetical protein
VAVRLVYLVSLERSLFSRWSEWTGTDEHGTIVWAARIAGGNWLDVPPFRHFAAWQQSFGTPEEWDSWYPKGACYQGVVYPWFVALFRVVFGPSLFPVRLAHLLLASAAAAALSVAARNVASRLGWGDRSSIFAGLVSGLAVGLYAPAVFHDGFILRDGPLLSASVLLVAAPFLRIARTSGGAAVSGLLAGGAILLKQTVVPLSLFSLFAVVSGDHANARRRRVLALSCLAFPLLLLVGRNLAAGASPFAYDTRQGIGFAGFLSRGSDGTVVPSPLTGTILREANRSTMKAAVLAIQSHAIAPGGFFRLIGRKIATFFHGFEVPDNANFYLFRQHLFPLRFLPVYGCLLGPGLVGLALVFLRRDSGGPERWVIAAALLVPFVSSVLPAMTSRYRLGIAAPLALGAGLLAAWLVRDGAWRPKVAAAALAVGLSLVTLLPPVIPAARNRGVDEQVLEILRTTPPRPIPR